MVMVCAGHRSAHRPQRMQIVSSFTITEPKRKVSSEGPKCCNCPSYADASVSNRPIRSPGNSNWLRGTSDKHFSGHTSTQPPHKMHSVPCSSLPSKIVLTQHFRHREASSLACSSV